MFKKQSSHTNYHGSLLIFYSLGAGSATSVCYPKETVVYSKGLYIETQRLSIIAYNFVTGGLLQIYFHPVLAS